MKQAGRWDVVVVGAGSAGCVMAARLSQDGGRKVLLIEAGGSDRSQLIRKPGMVSIIHTVPQVKKMYDWGYKMAPRQETLGRKIPQVRGKVLGGSSAINGMVFVRGNRRNYEDWEAEGCDGWGWDDVLPFFKKLEDWQGGADDYRGAGGPIAVDNPHDLSPVTPFFEEAVGAVAGVKTGVDYNGADQEGVGPFQQSCRGGVRYSTAEAYLHPALSRPNLDLVTGATVDKAAIEGGRATGVLYRVGDEEITALADEVIVCGGAIGSPQILMRSGVGPASHLSDLGIAVEADLPVGQNLHDHLFFPLTFLTPNGGHRGTPWHFFAGMFAEYTRGGTWFGRSVFESVAFLRTSRAGDIPDLQLHALPWAYPSPNQDDTTRRPEVDTRPAFTVQPTLIYPESRGELLLTSKDPTAAPIIDPHYLEAEADVEVLLEGIALTREVFAHESMGGEVLSELHPGPGFFDKAALRKELPNRIATVYHPVGTCRMGGDERAVVDPQCRVRGIDGLRVVDASIFPSVTGGNTNAPSIMVAERLAGLMGIE